MRHPYVMRQVVREFVASPVSWGKEPILRSLLGDASRVGEWPHWVELSCGHIKRDPWQVYGNETAVRVAAVFHRMGLNDKPRRCRCHECKKEPKK